VSRAADINKNGELDFREFRKWALVVALLMLRQRCECGIVCGVATPADDGAAQF
jgi:hypothetical protein